MVRLLVSIHAFVQASSIPAPAVKHKTLRVDIKRLRFCGCRRYRRFLGLGGDVAQIQHGVEATGHGEQAANSEDCIDRTKGEREQVDVMNPRVNDGGLQLSLDRTIDYSESSQDTQ